MNQIWLAMTPYLASPLTWIALLFGLCIGSFLNVCILRIPAGTFFKYSRSVCPACEQMIPWYYNIPLVGFILLRGRAACCGSPISWQYPLVELLAGVLTVLLYWKFPFVALGGPALYSIDGPELLRFAHALLFTYLLLICTFVDLRLMIIPDVISLPMIGFTPLVVFLHPDLDWWSALLGVVLGGGILYLIAWIYWLLRREVGLGMGDVKLLAAIGGWLGFQAILPTVFIGSMVGATVGILAIVLVRGLTLKSAIPFGPFLALGAFLHMYCGSWIQEFLIFAHK